MNAVDTRPRAEEELPSSFARLMDLYESNYRRLRLLLPELAAMSDSAVSVVPDCIGLYVQVIERRPYTTTLRLHYAFSERVQEHNAPYLKIRIYHDARAAEALTGLIFRGRGVDFSESRQSRWRRNRFLYRWLGYCLRRGHRFAGAQEGEPALLCKLTA